MESTDGHTFKASMINSESAGKVLYACMSWECFGIPQDELESVAGERDFWNFLARAPTP